jgi:membrane-bound ClpP family serine protease
VVSQGDYIENGERVRVVERSGNRVVVRRAN